jgi:hypothetical protein
MSAILKVLDAEIAKYESLVKQLKTSRQAIAAAESAGGAPPVKSRSATAPAKRRGRPPKNGAAKNGAATGAGKAAASSTGRKRGRPPKKAAEAPGAAAE